MDGKGSSHLLARLATPEDEAGARAVLASQAMGGALRLAFAREPALALSASIEGEPHHGLVVVEETSRQVVGYGSRAVKTLWVNGEPARVGYLAQLRRAPSAAGRIGHLATGFRLLESTRRNDELPFDITTILADNTAARRLLERGSSRLPRYLPVGKLVTTTLAVPRRVSSRTNGSRKAERGDLPALVNCLERNGRRFQLSTVWTAADLVSAERCRGLAVDDFQVVERGGEIVGCLALWDQRAFKQTVVAGYKPALGLLRPLVNLAFKVGGRPRLPPPGSTLALAQLSHLAVDNDDPDVLARLVSAALAEASRRRLSYVSLTLGAGHPLTRPFARRFAGRRLEAVVYRVEPRNGPSSGFAFDGRPLHLEGATL